MNERHLVAVLTAIAVMLLMLAPVSGQSQAQTAAADTWTPPRTPDGQPDLQGIWNNNTSTPLERPEEFADKPFLTEEERAVYTARRQTSREDRDSRAGRGTDADVRRAYNAHWFPVPGEAIGRTSLILDPSDGRIPPLTLDGQKRQQRAVAFRTARDTTAPAGPEDRTLGERCLISTLPKLPGGYNNHLRIVQSPGYVVLEIEMHHHVRVVHMDGRPHLPANIRQWMGDSRGRWEGDTLVVDTTNFTDKPSFEYLRRYRGSGATLHLVERFTRVGPDTLNYEFTLKDPTTWTRPWTAAWPLTSLQSAVGGIDQLQDPRMFEYACHEGNYGLTNQLAGARVQENATARAATAGSR